MKDINISFLFPSLEDRLKKVKDFLDQSEFVFSSFLKKREEKTEIELAKSVIKIHAKKCLKSTQKYNWGMAENLHFSIQQTFTFLNHSSIFLLIFLKKSKIKLQKVAEEKSALEYV